MRERCCASSISRVESDTALLAELDRRDEWTWAMGLDVGTGADMTARLVADARTRGCRTASLQFSPMAIGLYAALGFRELGRILEYTPGRREE